MIIRLRALAEVVRSSLFFVPGLYVVLAVGLAAAMLEVDRQVDLERVPSLLRFTVESARELLATVAGALITVAAIVFALTGLSVQLASSQFSPRVVGGFLRDRSQQMAIGFMFGTFAYTLVVLSAVRSVEGAPDVVPAPAERRELRSVPERRWRHLAYQHAGQPGRADGDAGRREPGHLSHERHCSVGDHDVRGRPCPRHAERRQPGHVRSRRRQVGIQHVLPVNSALPVTASSSERRRDGRSLLVLFPLLAGWALLAACSDDASVDTTAGVGPMAVLVDKATGASEPSAGTGTVDIGNRCVTFTNERGTPLLLVWRSAEIAWDEDGRTITFTPTSGGGEPITIADGDTIVVGGEPFATDEGSGGVERAVRWRAEPHADCPTARFIVHSVIRQ